LGVSGRIGGVGDYAGDSSATLHKAQLFILCCAQRAPIVALLDQRFERRKVRIVDFQPL